AIIRPTAASRRVRSAAAWAARCRYPASADGPRSSPSRSTAARAGIPPPGSAHCALTGPGPACGPSCGRNPTRAGKRGRVMAKTDSADERYDDRASPTQITSPVLRLEAKRALVWVAIVGMAVLAIYIAQALLV